MIPPDANAAFVAAMEDVIEVYHRPHDPDRPMVCVDETSKQLIVETRNPIPAKPGRPKRVDYEYERNGTANLFMMFAPLEGWRDVKVTDQRTAVDYAQMLKELSDTHFPQAASPGCAARNGYDQTVVRSSSGPHRCPLRQNRPRYGHGGAGPIHERLRRRDGPVAAGLFARQGYPAWVYSFIRAAPGSDPVRSEHSTARNWPTFRDPAHC